MSVIRSSVIPEVKLITPDRFGDHRGFFSETYRADWDLGHDALVFQQDNHAFSEAAATVRGLHFQFGPSTQAKLVRCIAGAILDVVVDIRQGSPTYGQHVCVELSAENGTQLLAPHGFAHGYCTITPNAHVLYKVDRYYDRAREGAVRWNDPALGINWPGGDTPQLTDKDKSAPLLKEISSPFYYDPGSPFNCKCEDRAPVT